MNTKCRQLTIRGKVQMVGFRFAAEAKAREMGISGWIRNAQDGTVECVICGAEEALDHFQDWCAEGPEMAQVSDVSMVPAEPIEEEGFSIRETH